MSPASTPHGSLRSLTPHEFAQQGQQKWINEGDDFPLRTVSIRGQRRRAERPPTRRSDYPGPLLLLARVEWKHIHLLAREGTPLEDLPEAALSQRSDLVPALQRGIGAGAATGMLAGLVGMAFPPAGVTIAGGLLLAMTAAGAGFGALLATMVGVGIPSSRLKRFQDAINEGQLLMMVDLPRGRVEEIEALVKAHHPDVDIEGTDPAVPAFP